MHAAPVFVVQSYRRDRCGLRPHEAYRSATEDRAFRRGLAMLRRVDGLVFMRLRLDANDDLIEARVLATEGDVPPEARAAERW